MSFLRHQFAQKSHEENGACLKKAMVTTGGEGRDSGIRCQLLNPAALGFTLQPATP